MGEAPGAPVAEAPRSKLARFRHSYTWSDEATALLRELCACKQSELELDHELTKGKASDMGEAIK